MKIDNIEEPIRSFLLSNIPGALGEEPRHLKLFTTTNVNHPSGKGVTCLRVYMPEEGWTGNVEMTVENVAFDGVSVPLDHIARGWTIVGAQS